LIFLIDYDRSTGKLVSMRRFDSAAADAAADARLELELDLNRRGIEREVVLLDAANEGDLRRTHQRYFATARELAEGFLNDLARR
jgi:hypothetical protein